MAFRELWVTKGEIIVRNRNNHENLSIDQYLYIEGNSLNFLDFKHRD